MCKTDRHGQLSELVVNIETDTKLSESFGTVEELSTWHDEWTRREKKRNRSKSCATGHCANTDWSHLGDC